MGTMFRESHLSESGEQLVWFQPLGYVCVRDVVRVGVLVYILLTALVTVLTSDILTLVFLGIIGLIGLKLATAERLSPRRRVGVYPEGDLFIAEHLGTGTVRHGGTPKEALSALHASITHLPQNSNFQD